jgi:hypothetical protein
MKTRLTLLIAAIIGSLALALPANAAVVLNKTNFPDVHFRTYIEMLTGVEFNDTITDDKIASVDSVFCTNMSITDLTGIQYFTKLKGLYCAFNKIKSIPGLDSLTDLTELDCEQNSLASLDLRKNTKLNLIYCSDNQLNSIPGLDSLPDLAELNCSCNQITSLDIHRNTELTSLSCEYNHLASLDLTKNPKLNNVEADSNSRKIKVYSIDRGTDKIYYIPLTETLGTNIVASNALGNLIDDAGNAGDPHFDMTKIVAGSWSGAAEDTLNDNEVLILDANQRKFSFSYNTSFTGTAVDWADGTSPNLVFYLTWSPNDIETGVDGVNANGISIYSTAGHINVASSPGSVNVFAIDGKAVYSGNETSIAVPAGVYIVRAGGMVKKVLVR